MISCWHQLEATLDGKSSISDREYLDAFERTRRMFLRVQERDFSYSYLPHDWIAFTTDSRAKRALFEKVLPTVQRFTSVRWPACHVYGGLKSDESIEKKLSKNWSDRVVFDLWDVVRFRIVAPNLRTLLDISLAIWDDCFDQVGRCRNYYYRPRNGPEDPYRAIHFELLQMGRPVELQIMSTFREAICQFDHRIILKKMLPFLSAEHEMWLRSLSKSANVLEVRSLI